MHSSSWPPRIGGMAGMAMAVDLTSDRQWKPWENWFNEILNLVKFIQNLVKFIQNLLKFIQNVVKFIQNLVKCIPKPGKNSSKTW